MRKYSLLLLRKYSVNATCHASMLLAGIQERSPGCQLKACWHDKSFSGVRTLAITRRFFLTLLAFSVCLLSACSVLSPVKSGACYTYVLSDVPCVPSRAAEKPITLFVARPLTNAVYNTTQMAYSRCPYQVSYFAKNGWGETPPRMLHPLIVQTMQNTHYFRAVIPSVFGNYQYALNTQLLELKQQFYPCYSVVVFKLRAQIVDYASSQVIASEQFCVTEPAPCCNPYGGVIAANRAVCRVLRQLAEFCLVYCR